MSLQVLVVSKGHDYDHDSFREMFASFSDIEATLVEHPAAQSVLASKHIDNYDVVFFYDMCGIPGVPMPHDNAGGSGVPTAEYAAAVEALVASGKGLLVVNHATVSWARWPLWREITGSSFMLSGGELCGEQVPGSGYRGGHGPLQNATITLLPQIEHPVLAGLEEGLSITDELYLKTDLFGPHVLPLLRGDYKFVVENFTAPPLAPAEEQCAWQHPPGTDLIVWANAVRSSPVVVSDVGDGPLAFENPAYRQLISNAIHWLATSEAREWATQMVGPE